MFHAGNQDHDGRPLCNRESAVSAWELAGYHKAAYEIHAERCRKISRKYADAMGYDYDKALERCRRRRARDGDTGMDGLEALVRRCGDEQNSIAAKNSKISS